MSYSVIDGPVGFSKTNVKNVFSECGRYRAVTVGNLPSAVQSDNEGQWNSQETSENLARGCLRCSSTSSRSPLVIEMAREIEHLKSRLAAFQTGQRLVDGNGCYDDELSGGGMAKSGNIVDDHTSSPVTIKSDIRGSLLTQQAPSGPSTERGIATQDLGGYNQRWT